MKNTGQKIKGAILLAVVLAVSTTVFMMRGRLRELFWETVRNAKSSPEYLLLFAIIAAIIILIVILYLIFRSSKQKAPPVPMEEKAPDPPPGPVKKAGEDEELLLARKKLRDSFARAMAFLKIYDSDQKLRYRDYLPWFSDFHYGFPWIMMVGESGAGKTAALGSLPSEKYDPSQKLKGLSRFRFWKRKDDDTDASDTVEGCSWYFSRNGVVLDIDGSVLFPEKKRDNVWSYLLGLLQKHRPKRPIDGIVIAIPCSKLMQSDEAGMNLEKADALYNKLWRAQRMLGIRFPVYVLVTQCDRIEGFQSFCREIPPKFLNDICGWSSPYDFNREYYSSGWVDEAFRSVIGQLSKIRFEIFTKKADVRERDGLFLFPEQLGTISEPLKNYLDRLFQKSVYRESFILRGIYFSGDPGIGENGKRKIAFAKDLFEKKVFPEFKLARPFVKALVFRNRKVHLAQLAALVILIAGTIGLWTSHDRLEKDKKSLLPVLEQISEDVDEIERLREKNAYTIEKDESNYFEQSAPRLFTGMAKIRDLKSLSIPSSLFSDIHGDIEDTMTTAYKKIILLTMERGLGRKAEKIFSFSGRRRTAGLSGDGNSLESFPEYMELHSFLTDLNELEKHADLYNGLGKSGKFADLSHIVKYLYEIDFQESYRATRYFRDMLKIEDYDEFDFKRLKAKVRSGENNKYTTLCGRFFDRLERENSVLDSLNGLSEKLDRFRRESQADPGNVGPVMKLLGAISETQDILSDPSNEWMFKDKFSEGPFGKIIGEVGKSSLLDNDYARDIKTEGEIYFRGLKKNLEKCRSESFFTGSLLNQKNDKITNELAGELLTIQENLRSLLDWRFMVPEESKEPLNIRIPPGQRLVWDLAELKSAVGIFEEYQEFKRDGIDDFSKPLQTMAKDLANSNVKQKILNIIERAHYYEKTNNTEEDLRKEIGNFKKSSAILNWLLTRLDELGDSDPLTILSACLSAQFVRLMVSLDELLEKENLYGIRGENFSWWDGRTLLSSEAFDVRDMKELEHFLRLQRDRIRYMAYEYAEPLVAFFSSSRLFEYSRAGEQELFKWERILTDFGQYEKKNPNNPITALEKFILFDLDEINEKNYYKMIRKADLAEQSGDFFLQKRNRMRRFIHARCQILAGNGIVESYEEMRDFFNKYLAGRFPFSPVEKIRSEADPEDIRRFFHFYDRNASTLIEVLKINDKFGDSRYQVIEFLIEMGKLRKFFESYIDSEKEKKQDVPVFDIFVKLRTCREREKFANKIIEWKLEIGETLFEYNDAGASGKWKYGDAVRFTLRWPKNAVEYPVSAAGTEITGKTIKYDYPGKWSLFRLLRTRAVDKSEETDPYTLKFDIVIRYAGMENWKRGNTQTRVYNRVTLTSPDATEKYLLLPYFPPISPELVTEGVAAATRLPENLFGGQPAGEPKSADGKK